MNKWARQIHRWLSMIFTAAVVANFVALGAGASEQTRMIVGFAALPPLFLLLFTGLYLFASPYLAKGRA